MGLESFGVPQGQYDWLESNKPWGPTWVWFSFLLGPVPGIEIFSTQLPPYRKSMAHHAYYLPSFLLERLSCLIGNDVSSKVRESWSMALPFVGCWRQLSTWGHVRTILSLCGSGDIFFFTLQFLVCKKGTFLLKLTLWNLHHTPESLQVEMVCPWERQTCVKGYLNGRIGGVCVVTVPEGSQERLFLRKKRNHRKRLSGNIEVA